MPLQNIEVNSGKIEIQNTGNVFEKMYSLLNPASVETEFPQIMNLSLPRLNFSKLQEELETLARIETSTINAVQNRVDHTKMNYIQDKVCTHTDKKIYARNMCNHCYRNFGQNKLAWTCQHKDRQHYAKGRCQLCYLKEYHRSRVFGKRRKCKKMS